jgi:mono/diheme cytochrome c family protein
VALAVWRALYFRPVGLTNDLSGTAGTPDAARSAEWRRGAYLVEGLGHCNACHASRNALGATAGPLDLAGGLIPVQNWYAPSLTSRAEAGVAGWDTQHIVDLLLTGVADPGGQRVAVAGPMGEVVAGGTQHLSPADLQAMAAYLKALPESAEAGAVRSAAPLPAAPPAAGLAADRRNAADTPGAQLYEQHCAACHGAQGEGVARIYPALAGNRAVTLATPANLIHLVIEGGFAPATAGNPRPFGMPPFATVLSDAEVAQVLSHIRSSWGQRAAGVSAMEVARFRSAR